MKNVEEFCMMKIRVMTAKVQMTEAIQ